MQLHIFEKSVLPCGTAASRDTPEVNNRFAKKTVIKTPSCMK